MKYLYFTKEDGSQWRVPLKVIAKHRTDYYQQRHRDSDDDDSDWDYNEEFDFVMSDDYEGIDWASNNINFDEISEDVELVESATEQDFDWCNCEKEIRECDWGWQDDVRREEYNNLRSERYTIQTDKNNEKEVYGILLHASEGFGGSPDNIYHINGIVKRKLDKAKVKYEVRQWLKH